MNDRPDPLRPLPAGLPDAGRRRCGTGLLALLAAGGGLLTPAAFATGLPAGSAPVPSPPQPPAQGVRPRPLRFPADFGAHPDTRTEWWYLTGWLHEAGAAADAPPRWGFQITFFRSRTGVDRAHPSAFAARQLVFAHAALTTLAHGGAPGRQRHAQQIARQGFGIAELGTTDTDARLRGWSLRREDLREPGPAPSAAWATPGAPRSRYHLHLPAAPAAGFGFTLQADATQPLLLQGDAGYSRKGPRPGQASHYYSQPQLAVGGTLVEDGRRVAVQGRGWMDHEWSETLLDPEAVGWDWIGMNLADGRALTAFRLRRADGSTLWSGGSLRTPGGAPRAFADGEVVFTPGRRWTSPSTGAAYPVEWTVVTPAGSWRVRTLLDAQELDGREGTGTVYWEGLSELLDERGARVGLGYLEMTGYAGRLRL